MCKSPVTLRNGVIVPCHECSQCRTAAIFDWVGRNIAESITSKATHCIELTYGRGLSGEVLHERAVYLTYSDVQKWLKRWRRHDEDGLAYPVRYFVTGEFGSRFGRAHWHVIMHWQDRVPRFRLGERYNEEHWEHGFTFAKKANAEKIRYVCKYIQKGQVRRFVDEGEKIVEPPRMSKKPPLGAAYFYRLARQYAEQGIAPQDLMYTFPGVTTKEKDGTERPTYFVLREKSAELFLTAFLQHWRELHPGRDYPHSDVLRLFEEYGRVVYDEALIGRSMDPHDWGRAVKTEIRHKARRDFVPDRVREEQAAEAVSRGAAAYFNHKFRWLSEAQALREIDADWERRHGKS